MVCQKVLNITHFIYKGFVFIPLFVVFLSSINAYGEGVIEGKVFRDKNENGKKDRREKPMRGVRVYIDENNNKKRDKNEVYTKTNRKGYFKFKGLDDGEYIIRQDLKFGWRNVSGGDFEDNNQFEAIKSAPSDARSVLSTMRPTEAYSEDLAFRGDYPFFVSLTKSEKDGGNAVTSLEEFDAEQLCSAAIISDRWLVTSSSCLDNIPVGNLRVEVFDFVSNKIFSVHAKNIIYHSLAQKDQVVDFYSDELDTIEKTSGRKGFDVALVELKAPLDLKSLGLQSIDMLPKKRASLVGEGRMATIVGGTGGNNLVGGTLSRTANRLPFRLQSKYQATIEDMSDCASRISDTEYGEYDFENIHTQLCLGNKESYRNNDFSLDSYDAILVRDERRSKWLLAGLASHLASNFFFDKNIDSNELFGVQPYFFNNMLSLSRWVKANAKEISNAHYVDLRGSGVKHIQFGNKKTRYSRKSSIAPRWHIKNPELEHSENTMQLTFEVLAEAYSNNAYVCQLDFDNSGPMSAIEFPCADGKNSFSFDTSNLNGVFYPEFFIKSGSQFFSRFFNGSFIIGDVEVQQLEGSLSEEDFLLSGYSEFCDMHKYFDIYDLDNIVSLSQPVSIKAHSVNADLFILLVSKDVLDSLEKGLSLEEVNEKIGELYILGHHSGENGTSYVDIPSLELALNGDQTEEFSILIYNYGDTVNAELEGDAQGDYSLTVTGGSLTQRLAPLPDVDFNVDCY